MLSQGYLVVLVSFAHYCVLWYPWIMSSETGFAKTASTPLLGPHKIKSSMKAPLSPSTLCLSPSWWVTCLALWWHANHSRCIRLSFKAEGDLALDSRMDSSSKGRCPSATNPSPRNQDSYPNGQVLLWIRSGYLVETRFVPLSNKGRDKTSSHPRMQNQN